MHSTRTFVFAILVILTATSECLGQGTIRIFNNTDHPTGPGMDAIIHYASDFDNVRSAGTVANDPFLEIPNVQLKPSGITNFIAVAEILPSGSYNMPGATFEMENGQIKNLIITKEYPNRFKLEVRSNPYFRAILGDEVFDQWQKSLEKRAKDRKGANKDGRGKEK